MFAQVRDEVNSSLNVTKKSDIAMKFTMQVMQRKKTFCTMLFEIRPVTKKYL